MGLRDGKWIVSFPTKHHWKDNSDIDLIEKSARQLKDHWDKTEAKPIVVLPRPGCKNGGLEWDVVKKIIEPILINDEFLVIEKES